jgi:hypothetical protein
MFLFSAKNSAGLFCCSVAGPPPTAPLGAIAGEREREGGGRARKFGASSPLLSALLLLPPPLSSRVAAAAALPDARETFTRDRTTAGDAAA